jgi:hypothetical protein
MSMENPSPETPATPPAQITRGLTSGKVRWRRFAILMIPAAAVAAVMIGLTAAGSIAASISVSGSAFEVTSTQLRGTGFEQFGSIATQANGTQHPVAVSVIRNATLQSLCQSVAVGPFTLVLRAGAGSTPVSAENLVVDADQLSGNATSPGPGPPSAHPASKHPPRRRLSSRAPPPWTACRTRAQPRYPRPAAP